MDVHLLELWPTFLARITRNTESSPEKVEADVFFFLTPMGMWIRNAFCGPPGCTVLYTSTPQLTRT